jgi:hypothetical protein
MSSDRITALALPLLLASLLAGCPGSLDNKEDFLASGGGSSVAAGLVTSGGTGAGSADDPVCGGIITERCARAGCHVAEAVTPDLSVEGREERLRDVPAVGISCGPDATGGGSPGTGGGGTGGAGTGGAGTGASTPTEYLLVDTANPEQSLVYTKCLETAPCGNQMPNIGEKLDDDELACLLSWVESL